MNSSKQFIPKAKSMSPQRHGNVKIWGHQNQRPTSNLDRTNLTTNKGFKSFTADKDKISKIFAPKLTVIDNNILVGQKSADDYSDNLEIKIDENWQNQTENPKSNLNNTEIEENNNQDNYDFKNSNSKTQTFINALFPKISFGKYSFGKNKFKVKTEIETQNKNQPKNLKNSEKTINPNLDKRYDAQDIFNKLKSNVKVEPKVNFFNHIKNSSNIVANSWWDSIKFDFYEKEWFRKLNYQFVAFNVVKNINRFIVGVCVLCLVAFFAYLSVFDQYFTIKKYSVEYLSGSYLNKQQTLELITHFQKNKLYRIFPNNQYWFANNLSLTASAKEIFPEIKNVNVKNRNWPDKIAIEVETNKPILTLSVTENNEQKYWRINENGKISSQDKAAIWYNIVKVEKPYSIQGEPNVQLSLFNHSFENDPSQKIRFKTTKLLLDYFKKIDLSIATTNFPSISDTDIIMESVNGTKFLFDSLAFDPNTQIERLDYFLKSKPDESGYFEKEKKNEYSYFDFRIMHKVYMCKTTEKCNTKLEIADIKK